MDANGMSILSKFKTAIGPFLELVDNAIPGSEISIHGVPVARANANRIEQSSNDEDDEERFAIVLRDDAGGMEAETVKNLGRFMTRPVALNRTTTLHQHGCGARLAAYALQATAIYLTSTGEGKPVEVGMIYPDAREKNDKKVPHYEYYLDNGVVKDKLKGADVLAAIDALGDGYDLVSIVQSEVKHLLERTRKSSRGATTVILYNWSEHSVEFTGDDVKPKNAQKGPGLLEGLACIYPKSSNPAFPSGCRSGAAIEAFGVKVDFKQIDDLFTSTPTTLFAPLVNGHVNSVILCGPPSTTTALSRSPFDYEPGRVSVVYRGRAMVSFQLPEGLTSVPAGHAVVVVTDDKLDTSYTKDEIGEASRDLIVRAIAAVLPPLPPSRDGPAEGKPARAPKGEKKERENEFLHMFDRRPSNDHFVTSFDSNQELTESVPAKRSKHSTETETGEKKPRRSCISDLEKRRKTVMKNRVLALHEMSYRHRSDEERKKYNTNNAARRFTKITQNGNLNTLCIDQLKNPKLEDEIRSVLLAPYKDDDAFRRAIKPFVEDQVVWKWLVEYSNGPKDRTLKGGRGGSKRGTRNGKGIADREEGPKRARKAKAGGKKRKADATVDDDDADPKHKRGRTDASADVEVADLEPEERLDSDTEDDDHSQSES
eukprot:tig00020553_g10524.t1